MSYKLPTVVDARDICEASGVSKVENCGVWWHVWTLIGDTCLMSLETLEVMRNIVKCPHVPRVDSEPHWSPKTKIGQLQLKIFHFWKSLGDAEKLHSISWRLIMLGSLRKRLLQHIYSNMDASLWMQCQTLINVFMHFSTEIRLT